MNSPADCFAESGIRYLTEKKARVSPDCRGTFGKTPASSLVKRNGVEKMAGELRIKRIYEQEEEPQDGFRILVDRLWPRGVSKIRADLSDWDKEIAPSDYLRRRFHDGELSYEEFRQAYDKELAANPAYGELVDLVKNKLQTGNVTLLFGSKDTAENNAEVLLELLQASLKDSGNDTSGSDDRR